MEIDTGCFEGCNNQKTCAGEPPWATLPCLACAAPNLDYLSWQPAALSPSLSFPGMACAGSRRQRTVHCAMRMRWGKLVPPSPLPLRFASSTYGEHQNSIQAVIRPQQRPVPSEPHPASRAMPVQAHLAINLPQLDRHIARHYHQNYRTMKYNYETLQPYSKQITA